jgi:drug/metabolite transporter (DMT)-like permease
VITLSVFAVFSVVHLHQPVTLNQVIGFGLIAGGAYFVFRRATYRVANVTKISCVDEHF